jgi:hypothetical protein
MMSWLPPASDPKTLAEAISISIRPRIPQGNIVCCDIAGNEESLQRAIAALGPEFAPVAPSAREDAVQQAAKKN